MSQESKEEKLQPWRLGFVYVEVRRLIMGRHSYLCTRGRHCTRGRQTHALEVDILPAPNEEQGNCFCSKHHQG